MRTLNQFCAYLRAKDPRIQEPWLETLGAALQNLRFSQSSLFDVQSDKQSSALERVDNIG